MAEPIRLGIAGLGRAGWGMHCAELRGKEDLFHIVAGCDPVKEKRDRFADAYECKTYERVEDLVADPQVEMVSVATRSIDHFAHAAMALKARKIVFQEKPICATYEEAVRLKRLVKRLKGRLYVRHNRRNEKEFLHIRQIIASGILGDVFEVRLVRGGFARRDDWQTLKQFRGGQMLNWGPHIVDHALQLLEAPVKSLWSDLKRVTAVGDAEDHLRVLLTGTNGRLVDIEISGGLSVKVPEYIVLGTRGGLICSGSTITVRRLDPRQRLARRKVNPGDPGASFGSPEDLPWIEESFPANPARTWDIWEELYKAVRRGTRFPIALDEAVEVMKVISAAKRGTPFEAPKRRRARRGAARAGRTARR